MLPAEFSNPDMEQKVGRTFEITRAARALRAELGVTPGSPVPAAYYEGDLGGMDWIVKSQAWITHLLPGRPVSQKRYEPALEPRMEMRIRFFEA